MAAEDSSSTCVRERHAPGAAMLRGTEMDVEGSGSREGVVDEVTGALSADPHGTHPRR